MNNQSDREQKPPKPQEGRQVADKPAPSNANSTTFPRNEVCQESYDPLIDIEKLRKK